MPCKKCENGKYRFGNGDCKYNTLEACEAAHQTYDIIELVIDEEHEAIAIDAISLVTEPAIEEDFVYMNKQQKAITLSKIDEDKRLIVSPALIPYKQIYRYNERKDAHYYVYFTAETVRQAAEAFIKYHNNNNATVQHEYKVAGVSVIESWIVENSTNDKSNLYGYELPKGTWFVTMRIENDEVWQQVKDGTLKGLSIEGYFVNAAEQMAKVGSMVTEGKDGEIELPLYDSEEEALAVARKMGCEGVHEHTLDGKVVYMPCSDHDIIKQLSEILQEDCGCEDFISPNPCTSGYVPYGHKIKDGRKVPNCIPVNAKKKNKVELASYTDYPKAATANAERAIIENEERGNKCATQTGKVRAQQLAARRPISYKTVKRVYSYLSRAKTYNTGDYNDCGTISYNLWGGDEMLRWAKKIVERENKTN